MSVPRRLGRCGPAVRPGETAVGALPVGHGTTAGPGAAQAWQFSLWAPSAKRVELELSLPGGSRCVELERVGRGYHETVVDACPAGTVYGYRLDGAEPLADPASRSQASGASGLSSLFDPTAFEWSDAGFVAPPLWSQSIYELHVGTFTPEGTFDGAVSALDHLEALGIGAVELMPVAEFPGRRNWGYDGVFPFAAQSSYGGPSGLQRLVDACHGRNIAVVLDVVYNHIGPESNVLGAFGPYFTDRYRTPWGPAVNYDGEWSDEVRRYFTENALGWLRDFHIDMLRLDAVHGIVDPTASPFLAELSEAVAEQGALLGRPAVLIAESADNNPKVVTERSSGGLGMDAQWNDDFHHALHVALTGERVAYYEDFSSLGQLARAESQGFVYQGEYSVHRKRRHGAPSASLDPERLVVFAQNHDHIGNRPRGERLSSLVDVARLRLAAAVVMLAPGIPLIFMGEEYGATQPFPYFVDHAAPELVEAVRQGRAAELGDRWGVEPLDPGTQATFQAAVLDLGEALFGPGAGLFALYRGLLALRRAHPDLARSARHEATAWAEGDVLRSVRGRVQLAFNFGDEPASVVLPPRPGSWKRVVDGGDPALGGTGSRAPEQLDARPRAASHVTVGRYDWVAYEPHGFGWVAYEPQEGTT